MGQGVSSGKLAVKEPIVLEEPPVVFIKPEEVIPTFGQVLRMAAKEAISNQSKVAEKAQKLLSDHLESFRLCKDMEHSVTLCCGYMRDHANEGVFALKCSQSYVSPVHTKASCSLGFEDVSLVFHSVMADERWSKDLSAGIIEDVFASWLYKRLMGFRSALIKRSGTAVSGKVENGRYIIFISW